MSAINIQTLYSKEDASVNFLFTTAGTEGKFEARYIRRTPEKVSIYLSSQKGCNQACRFCHLTQMGETNMTQATAWDYRMQVLAVMDHYRDMIPTQGVAQRFEVNFMARGEALLNPTIMDPQSGILDDIKKLIGSQAVTFNISTIFPSQITLADTDHLWQRDDVELFYSLYSLNEAFRRKWLPKAHSPHAVGAYLSAIAQSYETPMTIHYCFIKGENDSTDDSVDVAIWVATHTLLPRLNVVRFNPANDKYEEADESVIKDAFEMLSEIIFTGNSRIVPRVGRDVAASCGTFV